MLSEEEGLISNCGLALLPLVCLGFSGKFYRWRRVAGQSRWVALLPTGMSSLWYFLSLLLIPTTNDTTAQSILMVHGGCLLTMIGAVGVIAVLPVSKRSYADREDERAPKTDYMTSLFAELTTLSEKSERMSEIREAISQAKNVPWEKPGDREEELAGALVALKGLLNHQDKPAPEAIDDGLRVVGRAFQRMQARQS